jgi:hypothetical protein
VSISTTSLTTNWDNNNFIGTSTMTYHIAGYVRDNFGIAINGAAVALSGDAAGSVLSLADGSYQFSNLANNKNYTVIASKPGYMFVPVTISTVSLNANADNQNFVGTSTTTYFIGGYIRDNLGSSLSGAAVALTGDSTGSILSSADGSYRFSNLTNNKNYIVTPSKAGYAFAPVSISTVSIRDNCDNQDFVGTSTITYYIAGYTLDNSGKALSGATVVLSGSSTGSAISAGDGSYQFASLTNGKNYTVTAAKPGYVFVPVAISSNSLAANLGNQNFVGTSTMTYHIAGNVLDNLGVPVNGASVTLSGSMTGSVSSAADGSYQFVNLANSKNYTVTPAKPGYVFIPVSVSTSSLYTNIDSQNFIGTSTMTYYIAGYVRDNSGNPLSAATVTLGGNASGSAQSSVDGSYRFLNLTNNKNYSVTPAKPGYIFAPLTISTTSLAMNWDNNNFIGTSTMTYYIAGYVRDNSGSAMSGTSVGLGGGSTGSVLSAGDGSYQFTNLANSKNYTVTPSRPGYSFVPVSVSTGTLTTNLNNQNFVGTSTMTYFIGGYVRDNSGASVSGAVVALSGSALGSLSTPADGSYQFPGLLNSKNYTVTPSKSGYSFTPVSISTSSLGANMANQNFTALALASTGYYMKGYILNASGTGISGVSVALTGGVTMSTSTPVSGQYQFLNLPGYAAYFVTPSKTGLIFSPGSINITSLNTSLDNQNFTVSNTNSISGYVYDTRMSGISGATVALAGSKNVNVVTAYNGSYSFSGVPAAGSYVVTATVTNYGCTPAPLNILNLSNDLTNQNFTCKRKYYIRGNIGAASGGAISKAVVLLSGDQAASTTTDDSGNYQFDDLNEDGTYNIIVNKDGYLFNPATRSTSTLEGILEDWNFIGTYLKSMSAGDIKVLGSLAGKGTINPDRGDTAKIYFIGTGTSRMELKIYTLKGELVWEDSKDGLQEGMFEWIPKNIASGTYVAHVKGPGINKSRKIIIIR